MEKFTPLIDAKNAGHDRMLGSKLAIEHERQLNRHNGELRRQLIGKRRIGLDSGCG